MKRLSRVGSAAGVVVLLTWAGAAVASAELPTPPPVPSPSALPAEVLPSPVASVLHSLLPKELIDQLPAGVDVPDLLGTNPDPEANGSAAVPRGSSAVTNPATTGGGSGGSRLVDPASAATTSDLYLDPRRAEADMSFADRAARLAGPMALPVAAALLALVGLGMMARGRGTLGSLEDDKEALGGWTVIRL